MLRRPSVPRELLYRFAPALVAAVPQEAVECFIGQRPALEPLRLVPALLRYGAAAALACIAGSACAPPAHHGPSRVA